MRNYEALDSKHNIQRFTAKSNEDAKIVGRSLHYLSVVRINIRSFRILETVLPYKELGH